MAEKRIVRMQKQEEVQAGAVVRGSKSITDLMDQIEVEKPEVVAKNLSDAQLDLLIEYAAVNDATKKKAEALVKLLKPVILSHAELNKWKTRVAAHGSATIKPATSTEVKPSALLKKLVELGKRTLFDTVFKVKLTESKEYLGVHEMDDISKKVTEEYGQVSLKVK